MASRLARHRIFSLATATALLAAAAAPACGAGLDDLLGGGFLQANNARFDNWQLLGLDDTGAPPPDLSLIQVTPLANDPANPGLQFSGGGQLAVTGLNALELELRFQVRANANANSFAGQALAMTGVTFGGDGGIATISQEVASLSGADLGPTVVIADNESNVSQFTASAPLAPHLNLSVTLNVFLIGLAPADSITLATFTQRFAQTGPPSLAGDFNSDRRVDGADLLRWQRGQSPTPLGGPDLAAWRNNYGADIATVAAAAPVPEPGSLPLASVVVVLWRRSRGAAPRRASSAANVRLRPASSEPRREE